MTPWDPPRGSFWDPLFELPSQKVSVLPWFWPYTLKKGSYLTPQEGSGGVIWDPLFELPTQKVSKLSVFWPKHLKKGSYLDPFWDPQTPPGGPI